MLYASCAIAAAFFFAVATAMQHRAAQLGDPINGDVKQRSSALLSVVRRPFWLIGVASDVAGCAFHSVALTLGNLAVVQPLLVTGLLFALPLEARFRKRRMTGDEYGWAALVVASLAGFLMLARPSGGTSSIETEPSAAALTCATAIGIGCVLVARSQNKTRRAAALGILAGVLFALAAALIKAVGTQLSGGLADVVTTWPVYALAVVGPLSIVVNQTAFQAGPLSASLPALTAVDPLVSIPLGLMLFDEKLHGGALAAVFQLAALILLAIGTLKLAHPNDPKTATPESLML